MTVRLIACALLVSGCLDPDAFAPGPSASLYDNGVRLRVTACPNAGFLSCTPPKQFESASVSLDGTTVSLERTSPNAPVDVDAQTDPDGIPATLYDYNDDVFAVELASPANPSMTIAIDGNTSGVTEPSAFAVDVSSAGQQVIVGWDVMANAVAGSTDVFVFTTCGSNTFVSERIPSGSAQQVQLDRDEVIPESGCTSTVEVSQLAPLSVDGAARIDVTRIVQATIPSQP